MTWKLPTPKELRKKRVAQRRKNLRALAKTKGSGGTYTGTTTGPAPKGEKTKPGKRTPTKEEARWMAQIVAHGCIACRLDGHGYVPAEVHHILRGGVRMGHLHTIPLCSGHHRKGAGRPGLTARHPDKARFEEQYGPEEQILGWLRGELARTGEFA